MKSKLMPNFAGLRMSIRNRVVRAGVGPLRRPAELIEGYGRFGEWLAAHPCDKSFGDRTAMYDYINAEVIGAEPIDYLEFGVFEGYTIRYWSELNRSEPSRFIGFDCFEGLPEKWDTSALGFTALTDKTFNVNGAIPVIDDARVEFVKGYFQDTVPGFLDTFKPANRLVLHMDADLYTSTLYVLCSLDRLIKKGTVIIFDEFFSINHEFRALNDYVSSFRRKYTLLVYTSPHYYQVAIRIDE